MFQEPKQYTGFAILHLNDQMFKLLRFNERFMELITGAEEEELDQFEKLLSDNELGKE